jgi:hypothetical protein
MTSHSHLYSNVGYSLLMAPANKTADANSTGLDLQNCDDATLVFAVGAIGDTMTGSNKLELEVQESDDNSTFTAVADTDLTKVVTGATNTGTVASFTSGTTGQNAVYMTGYKGNKRYVRGVANFSGTISVGTVVGVLGLTGMNRNQPVNT